jgi:steroid delta-isomerase-like uncharacterized protein
MPTTAEPSAGPQLEASKAIIRSFIDAWNTRDFDRFEALMSDDAVLRIGGAVVSCNPQGTRTIAEQWTSAFPDWRFDLLALIAEGDRVVAHMPYRGTHRQAILGIAPTSRSCAVDEIVIFRIADGKIAEAWEVYDEAGMWRQLGTSPVMPSDPAKGEPADLPGSSAR